MDLTTALATFPRRHYTAGPTPLLPLDRLSAELNTQLGGGPDKAVGPRIWLKRDDQLGLAPGGNKTRKLEFLVAEALVAGADTLVTAGGVQSNHCRLTLAAARREGLECHLVLEEDLTADGTAPGPVGSNPPAYNGNYFLFDLMGAESIEVLANGADLMARAEALAAELRAAGRNPYVIPVGGSNPIGALGYVDCARELLEQFAVQGGAAADASGNSAAAGLNVSAIFTASGSAGMQAGLVVGMHAAGSDIPVVGINVSRTREDQEPKIVNLVNQTADYLGCDAVPRTAIVGLGDYFGLGYALPTDAMVEAVRLFARTEAVLLDPVYTGKTAAGMIAQIRAGKFGPGDNVVLLHSGGVPGLYARTAAFA